MVIGLHLTGVSTFLMAFNYVNNIVTCLVTRRGIGLSTAFIGSQVSYTLAAESLIITTDSHGILAVTKLLSRLPAASLLELPSNWNSGTELLIKSQSHSHIATDDQLVSESWFLALSGAHDQMLITV
jgi:hypothetical protein